MQPMPAIKPTFQQTRIEYVPGMNKYSNLLKDVTEKELFITLVRIFNFLEKDIALLFENDNKNDEKLKNQTHEVKQDLVAELATKADIEELKGDNRELAAKVDAQIQELKGNNRELAAKVDAQIQELKGDNKELAAKLKGDFKKLAAKTDTKVEEIKGELKSIKMLIKILIGTLLVSISFFSPNTIELAKFIGKLFGK